MLLIIVSGRSGSGKSVALRSLEDMGFYCVDNLPLILLPKLAETLIDSNTPVAISLDIRNLPASNQQLEEILNRLPIAISPQIIYLDTDPNTLIKRYSETRRQHPLHNYYRSLEESIDLESQYLDPLRSRADLIINTTSLSVHQLADTLRERVTGKKERELTIIFESFGFKHGIPTESDFVFDVRFLPNPHWDPILRPLTGLDEPVINFLTQQESVNEFIEQTDRYLSHWLPMLECNNRSYLTIAIGCTGGQHRSVYIAEQLASLFRSKGKQVQIHHRNLNKT
ncbi:MAG: RNase adapter RapZ [Candidatus Schmidhempelia sp.]|nr:RNase adapter RapZ [Candidatus Schmidhempelia sp.]